MIRGFVSIGWGCVTLAEKEFTTPDPVILAYLKQARYAPKSRLSPDVLDALLRPNAYLKTVIQALQGYYTLTIWSGRNAALHA